MPTYEYACGACGHQWEQVQRIVEAPIDVCPKCGEPKAHRLISGGTNFILKGGGWYSDLYSSSKGPAKTESAPGAAPSAATTTSEGTKTETKATPTATPAASTPSSTPSSAPSSSN